MRVELYGTPSPERAVDEVRRDFQDFVTRLEATPSARITVTFGICWDAEDDDGHPLVLEIEARELRSVVETVEARGHGSIGEADLFIELPQHGVTRLYCHEVDVHIIAASRADPYLVAQEAEWRQRGWTVVWREDTR